MNAEEILNHIAKKHGHKDWELARYRLGERHLHVLIIEAIEYASQFKTGEPEKKKSWFDKSIEGTLKTMNNEFNLEKALSGKAVVHKDGVKVLEFKEIGEHFAVLFNGERKPFIYSLEDCHDLLRMAEEEMYIRLTEKEIEQGFVGHDLTIAESPDCNRINRLSESRLFKLVEVHGKD